MTLFCVNCKKEMRCAKTGLGVRYGEAHVYPGDAFQCDCGAFVIRTTGIPVFDPNRNIETVEAFE